MSFLIKKSVFLYILLILTIELITWSLRVINDVSKLHIDLSFTIASVNDSKNKA